MTNYVGVDVGERHLFAATLSLGDGTAAIEFNPTTDIKDVLAWCIARKPIAVAIDAPPSHSLGLTEIGTRRVAEELLSIGGCYGTPPVGAPLPGWMATGMRCLKHLGDHLDAPLDLSGDGVVFEVHQTYGFRSMLGIAATRLRVSCDPERILRPKGPRGSLGHRQRIAMLRVILGEVGIPWTPCLEQRLLSRLDWTDAAVSAALAVLRSRGETRAVGRPAEGTIVIADSGKMKCSGAVRAAAIEVLDAASMRTPQPGGKRAPAPSGKHAREGREPECALLRLGAHGLGHLSPEDTIGALRDQLSEHQIVIPVGVRTIGPQWFDRARDEGFWLLVANRGVLALALHVVDIVGQGRSAPTAKKAVLSENRDPWPNIEESEYWLVCDAIVGDLDEPIESLCTRQGGKWIHGVPANQTAWLGARVDADPLARQLHAAKMVNPK